MAKPHPPASDPRRAKLRLLAITAGAWGLHASLTARSAWAQINAADKAPQRLRIDYQECAVSLLRHKELDAPEKRFPRASQN